MTSTFGCPHCGRANPLRVTFCAFCGTALQELDAEGLARARAKTAADDETIHPEAASGQNAPQPAPGQPWLRPDFDKPDPRAEATDASLAEQPWLRPEEDSQGTQTRPTQRPQRLVSGLQGLLEPVELDESFAQPEPAAEAPSGVADLPYAMRRELRQIFATDLPLLEDTTSPAPGPLGRQGAGLWRRNWVYGLLLAGILLALWTGNAPPNSRPHSWPGVADAYNAIDALPAGSVVLVNWAYDPATAGEMDQATLPVIEHLLEKNSRLLVVSQLPGGPATARRLLALARSRASQTALARQAGESLVEGGYPSGGVGSLALLGQSPTQAIPVDIQGRSLSNRATLTALEQNAPALLLILAARAEDAQRWLEQVQSINAAPVVVVSSAAVDPAIRPYVDSGQIAGLVSGYAGGIAYQELLADVIPSASQESQRRQIAGQNWALAVLLLVIAVGNLAGLAERREA